MEVRPILSQMATLKELRPAKSIVDELVSKVEISCSKNARDLLSDCMVVSTAFIASYLDRIIGEDENMREDHIIDDILTRLSIPRN